MWQWAACKEVNIAFIGFMLHLKAATPWCCKKVSNGLAFHCSVGTGVGVWREITVVITSSIANPPSMRLSLCWNEVSLSLTTMPLRKGGSFALSAVSVGLSFSGVFPPWFLSSKITFSCSWSQKMTHIWESGPKAEVEALSWCFCLCCSHHEALFSTSPYFLPGKTGKAFFQPVHTVLSH